VISHDPHRMMCHGDTGQRDASARESWRDASTIRLEEVSKILLVRESLGKERWITRGMYSREGDA
jgi:hypothetical protein